MADTPLSHWSDEGKTDYSEVKALGPQFEEAMKGLTLIHEADEDEDEEDLMPGGRLYGPCVRLIESTFTNLTANESAKTSQLKVSIDDLKVELSGERAERMRLERLIVDATAMIHNLRQELVAVRTRVDALEGGFVTVVAPAPNASTVTVQAPTTALPAGPITGSERVWRRKIKLGMTRAEAVNRGMPNDYCLDL